MKRPLLLLLALMAIGLPPAVAAQESGVEVRAPDGGVRIGEPFSLILAVRAPADAVVAPDPLGGAWAGLEVLSVEQTVSGENVDAVHRLEMTVASFTPGDSEVIPAAVIRNGGVATTRTFAPVRVLTLSSLVPGEPLVLSPVAEPQSVGGAQSPWLVPAVVAAAVLGVALVLGAMLWLARLLFRRAADEESAPVDDAAPEAPGLEAAERLLVEDPVAAYRIIGRTVRRALTARFALPASSMTTAEIDNRLAEGGADSWVARLAGDVLSQCDAVVYAGYRPAPDRRRGDMTVAREIVEGAG